MYWTSPDFRFEMCIRDSLCNLGGTVESLAPEIKDLTRTEMTELMEHIFSCLLYTSDSTTSSLIRCWVLQNVPQGTLVYCEQVY